MRRNGPSSLYVPWFSRRRSKVQESDVVQIACCGVAGHGRKCHDRLLLAYYRTLPSQPFSFLVHTMYCERTFHVLYLDLNWNLYLYLPCLLLFVNSCDQGTLKGARDVMPSYLLIDFCSAITADRSI
jgi:hypothetical protein